MLSQFARDEHLGADSAAAPCCRLCFGWAPLLNRDRVEILAGHLVEGLDFHKFYFDKQAVRGADYPPVDSTIVAPKVTLLGENGGLVTYTRLVRSQTTDETKAFNETRVWERRKVDGLYKWKHVHFHRSPA